MPLREVSFTAYPFLTVQSIAARSTRPGARAQWPARSEHSASPNDHPSVVISATIVPRCALPCAGLIVHLAHTHLKFTEDEDPSITACRRADLVATAFVDISMSPSSSLCCDGGRAHPAAGGGERHGKAKKSCSAGQEEIAALAKRQRYQLSAIRWAIPAWRSGGKHVSSLLLGEREFYR